MNKLFFTALATVALFLVANASPKRPVKKVSSDPVPSYAVEVTDEAMEELRKISRFSRGVRIPYRR